MDDFVSPAALSDFPSTADTSGDRRSDGLASCCVKRETSPRLNETLSIFVHSASIVFSPALAGSMPGLSSPSDSKTDGLGPFGTLSAGGGGTTSALRRLRKGVPQLGQDLADSDSVSRVHLGQVTIGSGAFGDSGLIAFERILATPLATWATVWLQEN